MTVYVLVGAVDVTVVVVVDVMVAVVVVPVPVTVIVIVSALTLWGDARETSMARAAKASAMLLLFPGILAFGASARAITGAIRYRVWGGWTLRVDAPYIPVGHLPHKSHVVFPTLTPLTVVVVDVR